MGKRSVRAAGDYRLEGNAFGAATSHLEVEGEGEFLFGRGLAEQFLHLREGNVSDVCRPFDARKFPLVFDRPERLDGPGHRHELCARREGGTETELGAPADVIGFEPQEPQAARRLLDGRRLAARLVRSRCAPAPPLR